MNKRILSLALVAMLSLSLLTACAPKAEETTAAPATTAAPETTVAPETIEGWQNNSRIVVNGNFVMLAVAPNVDDVVAAFNAKF